MKICNDLTTMTQLMTKTDTKDKDMNIFVLVDKC